MVRVYECSYKRCRSATKAAFKNLNFGQGGNMIRVINGLHGEQYEPKRSDTRVVYAKKNDIIIGWAILVDPPMYHGSGTEVYFYVMSEHRRQGIGSLLMRTARKHWGQDFQVCKHDERSSLFFNKMEKD